MVNVYDCHSASRSSSWKRLFGEFTFDQQSAINKMFDVTRKLVRDQKEIQGISVIEWQENSWKRTTLLTDRAVRLSTAKAYVFSDSQNQLNSCERMEGENRLVYEFIPMSRIGSNRRRAEEVWVENFPEFTTLQILAEIQNMVTETQFEPAFPRTDHVHVNVQRHCMERTWKRKIVYCEFPHRNRICKKIRARTLVVSWAWIRKEMERNSNVEAEWKMGSWRWGHDDQLQWKWTPPYFADPVLRNEELCEAKKKANCLYTSVVSTPQPIWFFAQSFLSTSSQCLRSCSGHVRRTGLENLWLFRKYRETRCSEQFGDHGDANRIVDEQNASDQWDCAKEICCTTMTENSQIFQIIFNWSSCAPM